MLTLAHNRRVHPALLFALLSPVLGACGEKGATGPGEEPPPPPPPPPYNEETHLASHGVDYAHFSSALDEGTPAASELERLPRPIIGFFGLIESWIDLSLLAYLAQHKPEWSIVLVGKAAVDVESLRRHRNVHLLGRRPYRELPGYAKAFDVAVCPFVTNELTRNIIPIKLREYLSAGVPVVASGIPEAAAYAGSCQLVHGPEEFLAACERALRDDSPELRRARSDTMRQETWERKADASLQIALRVKAACRGDRPTWTPPPSGACAS